MATYTTQSGQGIRTAYDGLSTAPDKGVKRKAKQDEGPRKKSPATSEEGQGGAVRRSGRVRNQSFHDPTYVHFDDRLPLDQGLVHSDSDGDYEERWAVVSAGSQARLPAWRTRPARPTPSEARFLQPAVPEATRVYPPTGTSPAATPTDVSSAASAAIAGGVLQMSAREFRVLYMATVPKDRVALLASIVTALDHQLGPQLVEDLGLDLLGSKYATTWQPHEELLFCLGMCDKYRMFKSMRRLFLRSRSVHEMCGYYHNVWKTRSTPEADEFLSLREAAAGDREFWLFENAIRQRLAAMWQPASFGELPVSAAGLAPMRQRPARLAHTKLTPPAGLLAPAAAPAMQEQSRKVGRPPSAGGSRASPAPGPPCMGSTPAAGGNSSAREYQSQVVPPFDVTDPAALAAMPAQLPAITPRPGAFVLSTTPAGRMKLAPGLTHLGAAAAAAGQPPAKQQQQQTGKVPVLQLPQHMQVLSQQKAQQQQQCTLLLVPMEQQQERQGQLIRHLPEMQEKLQPGATMAAAAAVAAKPAGTGVLGQHAAAATAVANSHGSVAVEQQQQQPAAAICGDGSDVAPVAVCFPEMPRMPAVPLPDGDNPEALEAWLQALRACRGAMTQFKQQVAHNADAVMRDAQLGISQIKHQQRQALAGAERYLLDLSQKELKVITTMSSAAVPKAGQSQDQQQGHVLLSTEPPLSPTNRSERLDDLQSAVQQLLQRPPSKGVHKGKLLRGSITLAPRQQQASAQ